MHDSADLDGTSRRSPGVQDGGHAVVVGAGMAGLLAARVLASHFEQVTLVERDQLMGNLAAPRLLLRHGNPRGLPWDVVERLYRDLITPC